MPELPEVQTTVDGINREVASLTIRDVWTDYRSLFHAKKNNIKNPEYFSHFKKDVIGAKIERASRIGKNILIHLSNHKTILAHMKMTGFFFVSKKPESKHEHVHLIFTLRQGSGQAPSNNKYLAFSDLRKFAKIFVFDTENEKTIEDLMHLGPDPLSKIFTYDIFKKQLDKRPGWKIKPALMNQELIAGIGNIYSDEMLWLAGIHPLSLVKKIPEPKLRVLYKNVRPLLKRGIKFGGDSDSDYRNIYGEPGQFQNKHNVYRKTGEKCSKKDGGKIERLKVGGRSAHFCPKHQKLYK